jgi:hypothetical protein
MSIVIRQALAKPANPTDMDAGGGRLRLRLGPELMTVVCTGFSHLPIMVSRHGAHEADRNTHHRGHDRLDDLWALSYPLPVRNRSKP